MFEASLSIWGHAKLLKVPWSTWCMLWWPKLTNNAKYHYNRLKIASKKLFVTTPWDHLKIQGGFFSAYSPDELLIAIDGQWLIHMEVYELPRR